MKPLLVQIKRITLLATILILSGLSATAQSDEYKKTMKEIEDQFGSVPEMFKVYPEYALAGAWQNFKTMSSPESPLPPKYRELLQLAVASQIPCQYCIYFHTTMALASGATQAEIEDAIAQGAQTRQWSMILQGNQINFETFKAELDGLMKSMAAKDTKK